MSDRKHIRLLKWWGGRRPGREFKLMHPATAKLLIERGVAELVTPKAKPKPKRKAKAKKTAD